MAPYRQTCPGCVGGQAVAAVDVEGHTRNAESYRRSATEALFRADKASRDSRDEAKAAAEEHRGEAVLYAGLALRSEVRAKLAIARLIAASSRHCLICGNVGRITGNGSAVNGGRPSATPVHGGRRLA